LRIEFCCQDLFDAIDNCTFYFLRTSGICKKNQIVTKKLEEITYCPFCGSKITVGVRGKNEMD
jgi:DNA-directed RNA polymerase subunit RPC12/RpoP